MKRKLTKSEAGKRGARALKRKLAETARAIGTTPAAIRRLHFAALGSKGGKQTAARWQRVPIGQSAFQLVHRETGARGALINAPAWLPSMLERRAANEPPEIEF